MTQKPESDNEEKNKVNPNLKRIDGHYISYEIQQLLNFEKGFLFTVKNLLLKPGKSIHEFLFESREKYVKPILFLIITSVIVTLTLHFLDLNYSFFNIDRIEPLKGKLRSKEIGEWTNSHIGYAQLIMGIFIGFWIKVFYRKFNYNIYEVLVLLSFVLGEAFIILGTFVIIASTLKSYLLAVIGVTVYFIYIIWAIGQFFGKNKIINYIKSLLAYLLGSLTYMILLILIAYLLKYIS